MRTKTISLIVLLITLVGLVAVAPVASQGPDEPFTATPLTPTTSVTSSAEKDGLPTVDATAMRGLVAEELEVVSIIVTFDESVDASDLEAVSGGQVIHRYNTIFNGASIILEGSKVDAIASMTGVTGVYLDELLQPDCDDSEFDYTNPRFIGAPSIWPGSNAGEGVVVGVLDTGIWPEHPSFADDGTYPAPPGGPYVCDFGDEAFNPNDADFECNNKLIGAYDFLDTYKAYTGLIPYDSDTGLGEFDSARDADGHGTHTSSTAAGNYGVEASMLGVDRGMVSGIAPRAHVIMYKVCGDLGCYSSDSAAAVQQAILDGVDVINFSISGGSSPYSDIVSLAFLDAYDAGVFVAASAGNSGPGADTVAHREPWAMTVAASTNDRTYEATVTLTDGTDTLELEGASITAGYTADVVMAPVADPQCLAPFAAGTFSGEIVVCERGVIARVTKSYNVQQGGAGGMILYNPVLQGLSTDPHYVPSIHIENDAGVALLDFMATHSGVVGTLSGGVEAAGQGDVMAAFSSRGGPGQSLGISKPDITAPGVQILAGNTPLGVWQGDGGMGPLDEWFQAIGGTSMSSPHIAGSAALIKALHPDWTPGQIKSALMTTAWDDVVKEDGETPADPFDYGSGRVDLNKAGNPGLTISATAQDYVDHETDLWNANYPSLYVPVMPGRITVQRTVHNELARTDWWRLSVDSPDDVNVYVPRWIRVPGNGDKTFNITVDARDVPLDEVRHATLYLKRGHKTLSFPITIVRQQPVVTLEQICDPASFAKGETTDCTITIANNSFDDATIDLKDILPRQLRLVSGSVVGADEHWRRWLSYEGTLAGAAPPEVSVSAGFAPYGYLPLSAIGAPPNVTLDDEQCINYVANFVYAGETYDTLGMVSNGYAVAGGCTGNDDISYINQILPDPAAPNNVLAPFWTDLNPSAGGNYYAYSIGDGVNNWMVLEWEDAPNYGDGLPNSFQIWVGTDGFEDISFTYGPSLSLGDGGWLTVGAENSSGTSGENYYADGFGTPPAAGTDVVVSSLPGAPGETHTITFTAYGRRKGEWKNCAYMTGDTFFGTNIACFSGKVE